VSWPLLVIGGSKGGIEALSVIFAAMPSLIRAPVALVLHRRPESSTPLARFVARQIHRDVTEPEDEEPLLPGRVYLAPADYHLLIEDNAFRLDVGEPVLFARPSIDVLFESAADTYGDRTVAVLLSGASEDGAAGIVRVARAGGLTLVQDPATAASPIAPRAALATGKASHVFSPDAIGRLLAVRCR
jgi:two-component system, chemotaxis family, protein-glutamate methylesterase/glutaminase